MTEKRKDIKYCVIAYLMGFCSMGNSNSKWNDIQSIRLHFEIVERERSSFKSNPCYKLPNKVRKKNNRKTIINIWKVSTELTNALDMKQI